MYLRNLGAFCALALSIFSDVATARQNSLDRAKSWNARRDEIAAQQFAAGQRMQFAERMEKRSNTSSFRYYNNASSAYLVQSLPDIPFDLGEFYSGQLTINSSDPSRKLFFVFQPTVGVPTSEITVWFNGGPGCSSLQGFLQENGLFQWAWGQQSPTINQYSWVNLTNMLWIEYPVGVNFAVGNVTATGEEDTAADFIGFYKNFMSIFGMKNHKTYVTGESYAGRYVPYVSSAILDQPDKSLFNLGGALMYDPCIGKYDYLANAVVGVQYIRNNANLFNFNSTYMEYLNEAEKTCGYADYLEKYYSFPPAGLQPALDTPYNMTNVTDCDVWGNSYNAAYQPNPCFNPYEVNLMCPILSDPLGFPSDLQYLYPGLDTPYFNRTDVKMALHVDTSISWDECSGPVFVGKGGQYGNGDLSIDPAQYVLPKIIEATNRVLVGNGDYDYEIITNGTLLSIQNMTWGGKLGFQSKPNTSIIIDLPDLQYQQVFNDSGLGGLDGPGQGVMGIQHYERGLMWAETFQSGHMQPQFQPRSAYRHLQWVLGHINSL